MASDLRVLVTMGPDPLGRILRGPDERPGWGLDFMGDPLLLYDLKVIAAEGAVGEVCLPSELEGEVAPLLKGKVPKVTFTDGDGGVDPGRTTLNPSTLAKRDAEGGLSLVELRRPWELLSESVSALYESVRDPVISDSATVASTAVISGPCVISDGVMIDDFCKIKGPVFIGPRTKIWTGSLVRESMIGADCEIGFGCEVARTYMLGRDRTAHHDVILDSLLGADVWLGAFIGTTNMLLDGTNVKYVLDGSLVDTGLDHFGAVFGHGCAVGAGTMILPGRLVAPGAIIQAGTVFKGPTSALR